jgi:hypothetical protein
MSIALSDPLIARLAEAVHPILAARRATLVVIDHGGTGGGQYPRLTWARWRSPCSMRSTKPIA